MLRSIVRTLFLVSDYRLFASEVLGSRGDSELVHTIDFVGFMVAIDAAWLVAIDTVRLM